MQIVDKFSFILSLLVRRIGQTSFHLFVVFTAHSHGCSRFTLARKKQRGTKRYFMFDVVRKLKDRKAEKASAALLILE